MPFDTISSDFSRYSRQVLLKEIGVEGQQKIKNSRILIIGCGGLGAPVISYLVAAGVGYITLADGDSIEISNLNRQVIYKETELGSNKADSAKEFSSKLNSSIKINTLSSHLSVMDIEDHIKSHDLVLDCTDGLPVKYLINDACVLNYKPYIHAAVTGFNGRILCVVPHSTPCLRCIFPEPTSKFVESCSTAGIIGPLCGIVGSMMALYSIYYILGREISGRYHVFNLLSTTTPIDLKEIPRQPICKVCGEKPEIKALSSENYEMNSCEKGEGDV